MIRFRRQHEQLRTVIVRVLRPSMVPRSQQQVGTPITEDPSESKTDSLDAADINAIEVLIFITFLFTLRAYLIRVTSL